MVTERPDKPKLVIFLYKHIWTVYICMCGEREKERKEIFLCTVNLNGETPCCNYAMDVKIVLWIKKRLEKFRAEIPYSSSEQRLGMFMSCKLLGEYIIEQCTSEHAEAFIADTEQDKTVICHSKTDAIFL